MLLLGDLDRCLDLAVCLFDPAVWPLDPAVWLLDPAVWPLDPLICGCGFAAGFCFVHGCLRHWDDSVMLEMM